MTSNDFAQLSALQTARLNAVEATFYAAGFVVRSVSAHRFGYDVRVMTLTWGQQTIAKHVQKAGYELQQYGRDSDGMFLIVSESAKEVQK